MPGCTKNILNAMFSKIISKGGLPCVCYMYCTRLCAFVCFEVFFFNFNLHLWVTIDAPAWCPSRVLPRSKWFSRAFCVWRRRKAWAWIAWTGSRPAALSRSRAVPTRANLVKVQGTSTVIPVLISTLRCTVSTMESLGDQCQIWRCDAKQSHFQCTR